jgi:glycolate oxidase FAD binding subunit
MTTTNIVEALTAIIGPDHVRQQEDIITVSPANTQQVSKVLRYANENALTVTPIGGGTKQSWGNPTKTNIHLDLTRLNRVIEHPWQDLTCTVQAGCTWQHLQEALKQHGQFVALDPLWPERATVGGVLATNDSGALRHRYGSLRDLVIGMTLVLADGTVARSGGKVVKNVAGYDLCKLVTGSFGTLAVVTEATFRLHPLPQHTQTFAVSAPQAQQLAPLMAAIRASQLLTQALQLRGDTNGFHLDIQLNAHPAAQQSETLAQMAQSHGLTRSEPPVPEKKGFSPEHLKKDVWTARESLLQENTTIIKLSVLPSDLGEYLDHMQWDPEVKVACVAQSSGLIFASLQGASSAIENHVQSIKADLTVLATPTGGKGWKANPRTLPLMQAIKHQFDPNRTLNPGRFLGGI